MNPSEFLAAIRQLEAAAELLAKAGPRDWQGNAFRLLESFRRYDSPGLVLSSVETSSDELFARTAQAALTMAGRNEFAAAHALLEQARSLMPVA